MIESGSINISFWRIQESMKRNDEHITDTSKKLILNI